MGLFRKLLGAFTAFDPTYPPYTNISIEDDAVVVTVRGPSVMHANGYPDTGATVSHRMTRAEFEKFLAEVNLNFTNSVPLTLSLDSLHAKLAGDDHG